MTKLQLLPCPFCGGTAARPDGNDHTWCTEISCGSSAYMHVDAWNNRHQENGDTDLDEKLAMLGRIEFLESEHAIQHLESRIAELEAALERSADTAKAEIMKFRKKTNGRYYPGYHEDMRDAVANAVLALRGE